MDALGSLQEKAVNSIINRISSQIDDAITEGLRRKGFEFDNKIDLMDFIINFCSCENYEHIKTKIFKVRNNPFLSQHYETVYSPVGYLDGVTTISASVGYFEYL